MNKEILLLIRKNKLFVSLTVFTVCFAYINIASRYNFLILSIFLAIGILALYGTLLFIDKKPISLNKTFCLFYYFFFSLAPITQYKHSATYHFKGFIEDKVYLVASLTVLASLIFYLVFYKVMTRILWKKTTFLESKQKRTVVPSFSKVKWNYLLSLLAVFFYVYLLKFKWELLIYRPFSFDLKNNTNFGLIGYSLLLIIRLLPFIIFLKYSLSEGKKKKHAFFFFILMLVVCFPTALSRGILAVVYIPIVVLYIPIINKNKNYVLMYCTSLLLLFPLFNMFRKVKRKGLNLSYELFDSGHFDAFQNFSLLVHEKIITNGEQLLTSVLFFVQENMWENKPPGTGHLLGEKLNFEYLNIAMPLVGEGYANFGYIGVFLFVFIIVLINVFLEKGALKNKWLKMYFYIFLGYEFYLLRGDLWSSIKMITSFTIAICVVAFWNKIGEKTKGVFKIVKD